MTRYQRQAFKELASSGANNTMGAHTRIAVEALQAGGASREMARSLTAQSLNALRNSGVKMTRDKLLEKFGQILITEVRDEAIEKYQMITAGTIKSTPALELHNKLSSFSDKELSVISYQPSYSEFN